MKLKNKILSLSIIFLILTMLGISSNAYAATATSPLYLGIEEYRNSGYAYKAISKVMWKISSYDDDTGKNVNKNRTIYCIKAGPGFGSTDMGGSYVGATTIRPYTQYFDFKDRASITGNYLNAIPSGANYNSLVWVLEHCYVPTATGAAEYRTKLLEAAGIKNSTISDDEIDVTQQLAIWYFTNNDNYKITTNTFALDVKEKADAAYTAIGNKFADGDNRNDDAIELFNYLIDQGTANSATTPTATKNTNPITLNKANATLTQEGANYIVGPFTITAYDTVEYTLSATLLNGTVTIPYTILDDSKNTSTLENVIGKDFYISIPKASYVEGAKFTIEAKTYQTALTYWSVLNGPTIDQPVVEIEKKEDLYQTDITLPNIPKAKEFDLALRKFITKINGTDVTVSREPNITSADLQNLANKATSTVTKTHTKTPLLVENGDTVLYTIRIYNEGELDGYAKEVTDFLPEGLELKSGSSINTANGWTNPSGDGKTIVTNKLATRLLKAFDGTTLDYADIEIECIVNKSITTSNQSLKNIAEITKETDENGKDITDRDSVPNNLTNSQKQNYNPGSSEQGWGYEDDDDYEELILPGKAFDLALRKFITVVNNKELKNADGTYTREPDINLTPLVNKTATTANYNHRKDPVGVSLGDEVIYTIRVYNEGDIDGYVTEITDYLPPQLEFVNDEFNAKYGWSVSANGRVVKTTITSPKTTYSASRDEIYKDRTTTSDKVLLKAFNGTTLDYIEVQIKCKVKENIDLDTVITNIAEITGFTDSNNNAITDRDSEQDNVILPIDENLPDYKGNNSNKSILNDSKYFYKGQQDDDDFDKLILEEFDLALRKFITGVNDTKVTNRYPVFTTNKDENGNYIYNHTKEPVLVETTDLVEYTIRIYNEGNIAGYAKEVKDNIPEGLEFLPENDTNKDYRWKMLDEDGNETTDASKAKYITTDYLSKEQESTAKANLIKGFDKETMASPEYKDVKVVFKVVAPSTYGKIITNTAEISKDSDETGKDIDDKDSTPDNNNEKEDDIDKEHIKLTYFDLALRKFITNIQDNTGVDKIPVNREPVFSIDKNGNYVYTHSKEPLDVENGNIVTYTLRIYNEGTMNGYAKQVKDDIPDGLEFLPENDINKEYRWKMLDKDGNETTDVSKAVSIVTDYLSKEQADATNRDNLLLAFDQKQMQEPDHRDIKIAFKVTEPNTSDRIIINYAQISDDSDEKGKDVVDKDSTPDKWIDGEDDQDIEKIKVKYFDLALRKWVTQAIVIENGKQTVTETGHKAEDDPEQVVKVEIEKSKINKIVVKFRYKIRVTNEGEIAGYAKEVSDYIPDGLKFVQADNPDWKQVDGKIVTEKLKDTLLQPGESAEVEVLLTWINGNDNLGLKVNVAEISKDYNDSNTPDIDSTPNNRKDGEDDIDDAPVILTVKTGEIFNTQNMILGVATLTIISAGIVLIKKYVL